LDRAGIDFGVQETALGRAGIDFGAQEPLGAARESVSTTQQLPSEGFLGSELIGV
jgi:hypothetical protein